MRRVADDEGRPALSRFGRRSNQVFDGSAAIRHGTQNQVLLLCENDSVFKRVPWRHENQNRGRDARLPGSLDDMGQRRVGGDGSIINESAGTPTPMVRRL